VSPIPTNDLWRWAVVLSLAGIVTMKNGGWVLLLAAII